MKTKIKFTILLLGIIISASAQENTEEGVDLLRSPASPAAQLLNIAPNTIERPTDLSSFWLSVNNATDGLAKFPTSYALDLSPAALFGSKILALKDLNSCKTGDIMWQSFVVSTGIRQDEDTVTGKSFYKASLGIKFSIVRPNWSEKTETRFQEIVAMQKRITKMITVSLDEVINDSAYLALIEKRDNIEDEDSDEYKKADEAVNKALQKLMTEKRIQRLAENSNMQAELKKKARDFRIERKGPFLDFSGGFAAAFPTNKLNYSIADKAGAWVTGGYEGGEKSLSILGTVRYLYQPETIFADPSGTIPSKNISTLDMGARLLFATRDDKFNLSFESLYRSVLTKSVIDPSWKLNFSAEYDLGFNKKLSISFGRDFDGVITKGGNLIAAINLIAGFGNKRDIR
ncbi:MAG: hypothetical protein U0T68_05455 [Ferruginibacter sp.]